MIIEIEDRFCKAAKLFSSRLRCSEVRRGKAVT